MEAKRYISVILPLKLEWEPFYALPAETDAAAGTDVAVGDRVRVVFAGRLYLGVVSAVDVVPEPSALSRIREIKEMVPGKQSILPTEIEFWRRIAEYYMCSVGEVFKAAYPTVKDADVKARTKEDQARETARPVLDEGERKIAQTLATVVSKGGTALLRSSDSENILLDLCLRQKGNVLWLVPELGMEKAMEERLGRVLGSRLTVWGSNLTPAGKRRVTKRIREGEQYVLFGTRSALFLPHRDLSLVIVSSEQDSSYKQMSPAPRYNGRDAALMLSSVFKAGCILDSMTPSLESVYNCKSGKFICVDGLSGVGGHTPSVAYEIIDTKAESRKNGMVGELSRKMLSVVEGMLPSAAYALPIVVFYKPRRAPFPSLDDLRPQLEARFGSGSVAADHTQAQPAVQRKWMLTDDIMELSAAGDTHLLVIFGIDALLGKQDFRADERALQTVLRAVNSCCGRKNSPLRVIVQTREPFHPVFSPLVSGDSDMTALFQERREFSLPPFTRLLDIRFNDSFPDRVARMQKILLFRLSSVLPADSLLPFADGIRVTLPRDRNLKVRKQSVQRIVLELEKTEKYAGHIFFDVDPV